jgi:uncharacterized protein (DUF111 family)
VHTVYGDVAVKIAFQGGHVYNRAPEYEDCRRVAREREVPLKDVYAAALAAAAQDWRPWRAYAVQYLWATGDHAINRLPT